MNKTPIKLNNLLNIILFTDTKLNNKAYLFKKQIYVSIKKCDYAPLIKLLLTQHPLYWGFLLC